MSISLFSELNRAFELGFKPLPWGDLGHIPSAMQPADGKNPKPEGQNPNSSPPANQPKARLDAFSRLAAALTTNGNHQ